jgi:hypothetical protein
MPVPNDVTSLEDCGPRSGQEKAEIALAIAKAKYPAFTIPDPLVKCDRCGRHAALYHCSKETGLDYVCGPCGSRV